MTGPCNKFPRLATVGLLVIGLTPMDLHAETIQIRSGEHAGFTRLVLEPETTHDWQLGRTTTGYELRMTGEDLNFATEDIEASEKNSVHSVVKVLRLRNTRYY